MEIFVYSMNYQKKKCMKRDLDLVRKILLEVEEKETINGYQQDLEIAGYSQDAIRYHLRIMQDADLIKYTAYMPSGIIIDKLTWQGHDFIAMSNNSQLWETTKKTALEKGMDFTIDLAVKILRKLREEHLSGFI